MDIYKEASDLWGDEFQKDMLIEECAELILAICRHRRGRVGDESLIEESVDVSLMINQLKAILDKDEEWNRQLKYKIERLEHRINEEKIQQR